jgi:hypothetical protein
MCVKINKGPLGKLPRPSEMIKDTKVYKVLHYDHTSPFRGMKYVRNNTYELQGWKLFPEGDKVEVGSGFHCWESFDDAEVYAEALNKLTGKVYKIIEMIIPEGSEYFNRDGLIVTSKLMWEGENTLKSKENYESRRTNIKIRDLV